MRESDLESLLAGSRLTREVLLAELPPELLDHDDDKIWKIGDNFYLKASSYLDLEKACQIAAPNLEKSVLNVYVMPYASLTCCRSLMEVLTDDDALCSAVQISIDNLAFVKKKLKVMNIVSPILEKLMQIPVELGAFLNNKSIPSTEAVENLKVSISAAYDRLWLAVTDNSSDVAVHQRAVLKMEFELITESDLYSTRKNQVDTLKRMLDKLEVINDNLNNMCTNYKILSPIIPEKEEDPLSGYLLSLDAKNAKVLGDDEKSLVGAFLTSHGDSDAKRECALTDPGDKEQLVIEKGAVLTSNLTLPEAKKESNVIDHEPTGHFLDTFEKQNLELFRESLSVDVPEFLAKVPDNVIIEVGEKSWIRVGAFAEFEKLCAEKAVCSDDSILYVNVMPYMSMQDCCSIRDCFIDGFGRCHGIQFELTNMEFVMERAAIVDCHFHMLVEENSSLANCLRKWLKEVSAFPDLKSVDTLLVERDEVTNQLITAMLNEGLDIHGTINMLKPEVHKHIFVEDGYCAECEGKLSVTSSSRLKSYKEDMDVRYPEIGSVKHHRILLLNKQGEFALSQGLWQTFKDLGDLLDTAMNEINLQQIHIMDICNRPNFLGDWKGDLKSATIAKD